MLPQPIFALADMATYKETLVKKPPMVPDGDNLFGCLLERERELQD